MFGLKGLKGGSPTGPQDGRVWTQTHFDRNNHPGSMEMAQSLGRQLFDIAYRWMENDRGARIEDMVAMLASVGGQFSLSGVLDVLRGEGKAPDEIGMVVVRGDDSRLYYFGDAPNWLLCEAPCSLVSLAFGAAHQYGAPVSLELLHDEMAKVAKRVGTADFLALDLPEANQVDSPLNWARAFCEPVSKVVFGGIAPPLWRPVVAGFALQQAIDIGHKAADPMLLAQIALQCSVRTAKMDPAWIAAD